jgi:hypothetical protein
VAEETFITLEGADDDSTRDKEEEDIEDVFSRGVGAHHAAFGKDAILVEKDNAYDNSEHRSIEDTDAET